MKGIAFHLNPGQVPVVAADQPNYATAKHTRWYWSEDYGEDEFIIMFGGIRIAIAAFKSIGPFLKDSGWTETFVEAEIGTSGTAESFLSAASITRTCQKHQITACCLYTLLNEAYAHNCRGKIMYSFSSKNGRLE